MSRRTTKSDTKRNYNHLIPDIVKRQIIHLYLTKQRTEKSLAAEFNVSCGTIQFWKRKFAAENGLTSRPLVSRPLVSSAVTADDTLPPQKLNDMEKKYEAPQNLPDDPELLKKMILELDYKVHSRDVMIDIAEESFGIQIRKKSGVKQ